MSTINIDELKKNLQERSETVRGEFLSELEAKRNEISKQIEQKEETITGIESEIKENLEGYERHRSLSRGPKILDAKVYKAINSVAKNYLAQVRERRRTIRALESEKAELQAEFDGINEENFKDELTQRQQAVKAQFISELKDKQEDLRKQILEKQNQIKKQKDEYTEAVKTQTAYESISGIKNLEAKTYKAANEKASIYLMKARNINKKIKKLEKQVEEAQKDFEDLDSYIQELVSEKDENILRQEKPDKSKKKQPDEPESNQPGKAEKKKPDEPESNQLGKAEKKKPDESEKEQPGKAEKKKPDESEKKQPDDAGKPKVDEKGLDESDFNDILSIFEKRAKIRESKQQEWEKIFSTYKRGEREENPVAELTPEKFREIQEIFNRETPESTIKFIPQVGKKYYINKIKFYFKNGKPVYEVTLNSDDNEQEFIGIMGWSNIEKLSKEQSYKLAETMEDPDKFYDPNIEDILRMLDMQCDTGALDRYMQLMQSYKAKDIEKIDFNVEYDFSNLEGAPRGLQNRSKLAYIKKIAKANSRLGRATYEKKPNFFKRLWNKMKTLKLNSGSSIRNDEISQLKMIEELHDDVEQDSIIEALRSGIHDQNFSISEFAKAYGISEEEVKTYIENPKIMGIDRNEAFRLSQRISQEELSKLGTNRVTENGENNREEAINTSEMTEKGEK